MEIVAVPDTKGEMRLDSRALAERMGNEHASVMKLVQDNRKHFEGFGILRFEIEEKKKRGQPAKFALLNENQCYFLLTLVRNSDVTVPMKAAVVAAFSLARQLAATAPAPQAGTPALISARGVSAAVGIPPRHASTTLRRQGIEATHHFLESRCGAPAYLYPLPDVQAIWPDATFTPYQGEARPGVAAVVRVVGAAARTKAANRHQPRLLPTDTSTEQLARRLLSLEAQKKAVLRELAALA